MIPLKISMAVQSALKTGKPVVALESTVLTHGLPYPQNFQLLESLEALAIAEGVIPATIAVIDGVAMVGLDAADKAYLQALLHPDSEIKPQKLSQRELPAAFAKKQTGGTTVSATLQIAYWAGIRVFATGGIGGVHRHWQESLDISADLDALASLPLILVCAGCKAILDTAATLEYMESRSLPVYGYDTRDFPAFYSRLSGHTVPEINLQQLVEIYQYSQLLTPPKGILCANPIPEQDEIPREEIEPYIHAAINLAKEHNIKAKELTPFLLDALAKSTAGRSITANLALLKNNLLLATRIAKALCE